MAQGTIVNVPVSIALSAPVSDRFTAMTLADSAGNTNIYSFNGGNDTDGLGVDDPAPAAAPAASSTWSTNCEVLSADQFQLNVTNNTDQGLTPPGWTVLLFSQGAQVGDSDDAGLGPVLGGSNSASPYAAPGQTVSSNVWTLSSVSFTSCEAVPYQG
jgi:hypothetical protein